MLEGLYQGDPEAIKTAEKSFNSNGYKSLKLLAFEEAQPVASRCKVGTVVGVINPKPMKATH